MSTQKNQSRGVIDPNLYYTIEAIAKEIGMTPRRFREQFVNTGEIPVAERGQSIVLPGWVYCQWIERNLECRNDSDDDS